jgi:hypothetical protein
MAFFDAVKGVLGGGIFSKGARNAAGNFLTGTPDKYEQISTLRPDQQPLSQQAVQAGLNRGAGGAFGDAADYYRNNLSDNPADFDAFAAPQMRQFNEEIIPGISEQFAGMGSGALSSSGFRNAAVNAGTDLSERLGAIRANLRQSSAQGLQNIGQSGLQPFQENVFRPGTPGLLDSLAPAAGQAATAYFGGPTAMASQGSNWLSNAFGGKNVGQQTSPYGNNNSPSGRLPNRGY